MFNGELLEEINGKQFHWNLSLLHEHVPSNLRPYRSHVCKSILNGVASPWQLDRRIFPKWKLLALPVVVGRKCAGIFQNYRRSMSAFLYAFFELVGLISHLRWIFRSSLRNDLMKPVSMSVRPHFLSPIWTNLGWKVGGNKLYMLCQFDLDSRLRSRSRAFRSLKFGEFCDLSRPRIWIMDGI